MIVIERRLVDRKYRCTLSGRVDTAPEVQARSHATSAPQTTRQNMSRWAAPVALLIAVVAVALAIWALMSASPRAPETALAGDPKMPVCTAFDTVSKAVTLQTNADLGPDPVALEAVAGNARLALVGSGISAEPPRLGNPPELADAVRSFAGDLQDIGINLLAGVPTTDPSQATRVAEADAGRKQLVDLCK